MSDEDEDEDGCSLCHGTGEVWRGEVSDKDVREAEEKKVSDYKERTGHSPGPFYGSTRWERSFGTKSGSYADCPKCK